MLILFSQSQPGTLEGTVFHFTVERVFETAYV